MNDLRKFILEEQALIDITAQDHDELYMAIEELNRLKGKPKKPIDIEKAFKIAEEIIKNRRIDNE